MSPSGGPDPEREFNVRVRHPERAAFHAALVQASAQVYRSRRVLPGLRYGAGPRMLLDVFLPSQPPSDKPTPLVAFLHGGYWQSHERTEFAALAEPVLDAGAAFALVGYDLAPDVPMEEIILQARDACLWLRRNAKSLHCDPDRLHVYGHSAGAHLAACIATREPGLARGAILVSGLYDLEPLRHTTLNAVLGLSEQAARACSPVHDPAPEQGEHLLLVGADESAGFRAQSEDMWRRLSSRSRATLLTVGATHHYSILHALADPAHGATRAVLQVVG